MGNKDLETERLILRKLKVEDADEAFNNWCNNDNVSKYMTWSTHRTVDDTREWLSIVEETYKKNLGYEWGIVLKSTNELIGSIGAYAKEEFDNRYEIGYAISQKYWRNGYTTESAKCVMDYLINEEKIKKFVGRHAKLNGASGSVMQKVGFRYIEDGWFEKPDKTNSYETKTYYYDVDDRIKKPQIEDSNDIAKLITDAWKITYEGLIDENYLMNLSEKDATDRWKKEIEANNKILIFKEDNNVLGVIKYGQEEKYGGNGEIYALYVKPTEKRKGIGTKLLNTAEQELLKDGYKNMIVWCLDGNKIGENFYSKNGGQKQSKRLYNVRGIDVNENQYLFKIRG